MKAYRDDDGLRQYWASPNGYGDLGPGRLTRWLDAWHAFWDRFWSSTP